MTKNIYGTHEWNNSRIKYLIINRIVSYVFQNFLKHNWTYMNRALQNFSILNMVLTNCVQFNSIWSCSVFNNFIKIISVEIILVSYSKQESYLWYQKRNSLKSDILILPNNYINWYHTNLINYTKVSFISRNLDRSRSNKQTKQKNSVFTQKLRMLDWKLESLQIHVLPCVYICDNWKGPLELT
jgi:hypothetical protein